MAVDLAGAIELSGLFDSFPRTTDDRRFNWVQRMVDLQLIYVAFFVLDHHVFGGIHHPSVR